jgi:hypothetical protein
MSYEYKTPELCLIAVQQYSRAFSDVPEEYRTPKLCLIAVQQCGQALMHVPEKYKTPEFLLTAVLYNRNVLSFIDNNSLKKSLAPFAGRLEKKKRRNPLLYVLENRDFYYED